MFDAKSLLAAASIGVIGIGQVQAQAFDWTGANNANWAVGTNWDMGMVPAGASAVAQFNSFAGRAVLNSSVAGIGSVEVNDPASILSIDPGGTLTLLGGTSTNNGIVELNRFGSSVDGTLNVDGDVTIVGTGEIQMRAAFGNAVVLGTGTLTNGAMHEIRGVGQVLVPIVNEGRIAGDSAVSVSGSDLELQNDVLNNGTLASAATNSLLEVLSGVTVTQGPAGQIVAESGNVVLEGGSIVLGGMVGNTGGAGNILSGTNATATTLESVTHTGSLTTIRPDGIFGITGSGLINDGLIQANPTGSSVNSVLSFEQSGMLAGSGEFRMRTGFDNTQLNTAAGQSITHAASHTIRGVGQVNAAMSNAGTIIADVSVSVSGNILELQTEDKSNTGLLSAQNASILSVEGIAIDQTGGGEILANAGGTVQFLGASDVINGSVTGDPTGLVAIRNASSTFFDNIVMDAPFTIDPGGTLVIGAGGIVNEGLIQMNPTGSSVDAVMTAVASTGIAGGGEIRMRAAFGSTQMNTAAGQTLTHGAMHTIRGVGEINAALTNNGTITADVAVSVSGNTLELQTEPKVNNGAMSAAPSSILVIDGVAVDQSPTASISAQDTGIVTINAGSAIDNGTLATSGSGVFRTGTGGTSLLSGVALNGTLQIDPGGIIAVDPDGLVNNGLVHINRIGSSVDAAITFENASVSGTGEIRMSTSNENSQINTAPGATVVFGAGQLIRGVGEINAALTNNGEIRADITASVSGNTLELQTEDMVNNADMVAASSTTLLVQGITLDQTAGGTLLADGGTVELNGGSTILGGSLGSANGGVWDTGSGGFNVDGTLLSGDGVINAGDSLNIAGNTLLNNASIVLNPFASSLDSFVVLTEDTELVGSGTISLRSAGANSQIAAAPNTTPTVTNGTGHTINGFGQISVPFVNEGVVRPGYPAVGTLGTTDDFTQSAGGTFEAVIAGNGSNGRLAVGGVANLGGTLDVQLASSQMLANNANHVILTAPTINGEFDTFNRIIQGQLVTRLIYEPTQVVLRTRCAADTNLDGLVTPADFNAWIAAYNMQTDPADQNFDGLITPADFNAWILNFNIGCP